MGRRKGPRFPHYSSVVGPGTEITGALSFSGGLHVDGRIVGDVVGRDTEAGGASAISIAATGVIEGNLNVPHVVIDGTVIGDVRAATRAVLASRARIEGTLYYGVLEMDRGAEVNGKLVHVEAAGSAKAAVAVASGDRASEAGRTAGESGSPAAAGDADPDHGART
jgi:cytoskeletal protein CcmA (bactofilin family)